MTAAHTLREHRDESGAPDLPSEVARSLNAAVEAIVACAQPDLVILFGSWAEGRAGEDSDLDFLVVAETTDRVGLEVRLEDALEVALGSRRFDLTVVPRQEWPRARTLRGFVTYEADAFGVKVYERAA